jgi:hypothetical protein
LQWPDLSPDVGTYDFPSSVKLLIKSNDPDAAWYLSAYAADHFRSLSDANVFFDSAQLGFRVSGPGAFQPMDLTAAPVTSGLRGEHAVWMDYQVSIAWDNQTASDYKTTVVYQCSLTP